MKSLAEVLSYSNAAIPRVFRETFDISEEETGDIFRETKKFLWLCALSRSEFSIDSIGVPDKIFVHKSMLVMDQMWHIFINHTKLYTHFCDEYLDGYVHHSPRERGSEGPTEKENELQLSYIYDRLGEDTLVKWYDAYGDTYSPNNLERLLKPQDFS
jgi:hypothetical protein